MSRSVDADSLNNQLLFSLPMFEGSGTATVRDVAKPHHPVTQVHAPVWTQLSPSGLWVMDFIHTDPDYLSCAGASCVDLNFTTGDFSMAVWTYHDVVNVSQVILERCAVGIASGWVWEHISGIGIRFYTSAVAFAQGAIPAIQTWQLTGLSRSGATMLMYQNGSDETVDFSVTDITTGAANNLTIGYRAAEGVFPFNGKMWNPRIWGRALSPNEHRSLFLRERHLFGV